MAAVEARGESAFLHRASSIPVVQTTLAKVGEVYEGTREHNGFTKYTFGVAEQGAKLAATVAAPLFWTVQKPLSVVDGAADSRLAKLEESYPVINKPTEEVISDMKSLYNSSVEPIASRVKSVKQKTEDSMHKISSTATAVKDMGVNVTVAIAGAGTKATKAAGGYGLKKAQSAVTVAADTRLGKQVLTGFNYGVSTAESVLDKFVPGTESEDEEMESDEENPEENRELRKMVTEAIENEMRNRVNLDNSLKNVSRLTTKLRRRLGSRSAVKLEEVRTKSKESLDKLTSYLNMVEKTRNMLKGSSVQAGYENVSQRLADLWKDISTEVESPDENEEFKNATLDGRALLLGRRLVGQMRRSVAASQRLVSSLPSSTREAGALLVSTSVQARSLIANVPSQTTSLLTSATTKTRDALVETAKFADSMLYQLTGIENVLDLPHGFLESTRARIGKLRDSLGKVTEDLSQYREVVNSFWYGKRVSVGVNAPEEPENCDADGVPVDEGSPARDEALSSDQPNTLAPSDEEE